MDTSNPNKTRETTRDINTVFAWVLGMEVTSDCLFGLCYLYQRGTVNNTVSELRLLWAAEDCLSLKILRVLTPCKLTKSKLCRKKWQLLEIYFVKIEMSRELILKKKIFIPQFCIYL